MDLIGIFYLFYKIIKISFKNSVKNDILSIFFIKKTLLSKKNGFFVVIGI